MDAVPEDTPPPEYARHELSAIFPDLSEAEHSDLVTSIAEVGLRQPILYVEDAPDGVPKILDGWHRYRAATDAGYPLRDDDFIRVIGDKVKLARIVAAENLARRHMTPSQRGAVVAILYEGKWAMAGRPAGEGGNSEKFPGSSPGVTEADAAAEAGVSDRTLRDAKTAQAGGLGDKVVSGELSASEAARQVREEEARMRAREGNAAAQDAGGSPVDGRPEAPADKLADAPRDEAPREEAAPRRATALEKLRDERDQLLEALGHAETNLSEARAECERLEERVAVAVEGQADGPAREAKLNGVQADRDNWRGKFMAEQARHNETKRDLNKARSENRHLRREMAELRAALGSGEDAGDADAREAAE